VRIVRLVPAPALLGFGVLTHRGDLPGFPPGVPDDLETLSGETAGRFRRMDRYAALAYAAAQQALLHAADAIGPNAYGDLQPRWGVMIGSSLACWASNARFHQSLLSRPVTDLSPALFVRTIANAAAGEISIARRLGGPGEAFVSGWTAGAEALAAAGAAIASGRAEGILAGGVEAPDVTLEALHDKAPSEAAAIVAMRACPEGGEPVLRLRAFGRAHDPSGDWSLAAALSALPALRADAARIVLVANTMPASLMRRLRNEAAGCEVLDLTRRFGELGAAATPVAAALAASMLGGGSHAGGGSYAGGGSSAGGAAEALLIARDPAGGTALLAVGG
jgi:hypothetical protein